MKGEEGSVGKPEEAARGEHSEKNMMNKANHIISKDNNNVTENNLESSQTPISSITQSDKIRLEPTRFPSLTFISQNAALSERETSIKNANLKSELIENNKSKKASKESLFHINNNTVNSVNTSTNNISGISPHNGLTTNMRMENMKGNTVSTPNLHSTQKANSISTNNPNYAHSVLKSSSSNTLQSVYTDAYSTLDSDEIKATGNFNNGLSNLSLYHGDNDDLSSVYQQSLNSNIPDLQYNQKVNAQNNFVGNGMKEDSESFIYTDPNSVDIMSMADHKLQKKISNGFNVFNNGNNLRENHLKNSNATGNNEFDFLDNQSVSTILTSNDYLSNMQTYTMKSPIMKRSQYNINNPTSTQNQNNSHQNSLSVSPTYSKVRQVSQKIFPNYNSNPSNKMSNPGITNYSKITLSKQQKHPRTNSDNISINEYNDMAIYPNEDDEINEESNFIHNKRIRDHQIMEEEDDHTGLTDAESMLAKPFRENRKNFSQSRIKGGKEKVPHNKKIVSSSYHDYGSINTRPNFEPPDDYNLYDNWNLQESNNSPHDYKSMYYRQSIFLNILLMVIYTFISLIILFSFTKIFIMANFDNPIRGFEVTNLKNVLVSDEILLVDIGGKAINVNFENIVIWNMDLDVFLVTEETNLQLNTDGGVTGNDITILLGNSNKFLTPLTFEGILSSETWSEVWKQWRENQNVEPQESSAQLKIYKPGKDFQYDGKPLSHEQWLKILSSDYKIILRGNLEYNLPLVWQDQFISIATEIELKPEQKLDFE